MESVQAVCQHFASATWKCVSERWETWKKDLSDSQVYEVIGALLARQATVIRELAENPLCWNAHVAPLFLRAEADVFITLSWILNDPSVRSKMFVAYGLGQAKLDIEHQRGFYKRRNLGPDSEKYLESKESWINAQRWTFLTDVNVGSWSGTNTRKMATEAGALDVYNQIYNPMSSCTHSMWHHIGKFNMTVCDNPLHRHHLVPSDNPRNIDHSFFVVGALIVDMTLAKFDEKVTLGLTPPDSYERLNRELGNLFKA
ncbi:MAG: DUF5677 domain-containing protein [Candidatus Zixiibacteriota bacterium]